MIAVAGRPKLAFVSPLFLFPNDAGGKIRSTNILRGLKGGAFEITLLSPASSQQQQQWRAELGEVCDHFIPWQPAAPRARWQRAAELLQALPVNVVADRYPAAIDTVGAALAAGRYQLVVFDFVHATVLRPTHTTAATLCFTHNVEAEIFARHAQQARNFLMRQVWRSQLHKMERFERGALAGLTRVIAVSERDARQFSERYGLDRPATIPTGVDLDFFAWRPPAQGDAASVVFTGSMDWEANIDGVRFFLDEVWPLVLARLPQARFTVVGRNPPAALAEQGRKLPGVSFTGFVDDVRPYVYEAKVFVIPLRIGGGTRIKAFEAMAMGCPVVATSVGMEGLDVVPDQHFLRRDDGAAQAAAIVDLLTDPTARLGYSRRARQCVEEKFGHQVAARVFEDICLEALRTHTAHGAANLPVTQGSPG